MMPQIKLYIPEKTVYLELKYLIESMGGYVETQLTANLLQVRLEYFLNLMMAIEANDSREQQIKKIKENISGQLNDVRILEAKSIPEMLVGQAPDVIAEIIGLCLPNFSGPVKLITQNVFEALNVSLIKRKRR